MRYFLLLHLYIDLCVRVNIPFNYCLTYDFHILEYDLKSSIADYLKFLADEERENDKLILIGINKSRRFFD